MRQQKLTPSEIVKQVKLRFICIGVLSIILSFFAKLDLWLIALFQLSVWLIIFASIGSLSTINQMLTAKFPFKDRKELR